MLFDKFKDGILVLINANGTFSYYFGDNSWWLLDDWESDILNGNYFEEIAHLKITLDALIEAYGIECRNLDQHLCYEYLPSVMIDFENKVLYNNFYDQALESRVIDGWNGLFIEDKNEFLKHIPAARQYWNAS